MTFRLTSLSRSENSLCRAFMAFLRTSSGSSRSGCKLGMTCRRQKRMREGFRDRTMVCDQCGSSARHTESFSPQSSSTTTKTTSWRFFRTCSNLVAVRLCRLVIFKSLWLEVSDGAGFFAEEPRNCSCNDGSKVRWTPTNRTTPAWLSPSLCPAQLKHSTHS